MNDINVPTYRLGEFHPFEAAARKYVYLVPAGAIFELDPAASRVIERLGIGAASQDELESWIAADGQTPAQAAELIDELHQARLLVTGELATPVRAEVPHDFPLQSLVMNLTNQCNLACTYCYEFGQDKIAAPKVKKKHMDLDTARASVDFLLDESAHRNRVSITFFGGETLMNFPLLQTIVSYATAEAARRGKTVAFSLTTNATLLSDSIIEFLCANAIGVTVSIDGPADLHDRHRVFKSGRGSYSWIEPRIRALLSAHKTRAIAARVTLTEGVTDVLRIYQHLKHEIGFHEVGFAPVTAAKARAYSIDDTGMHDVLAQFRRLSEDWVSYALRGEMHGFSNVSDTLAELIQGVNKSHPCGAALGLMGVSPTGDLTPCHRFADAEGHTLGHVTTGVDQGKRSDFLTRGHIGAKYDCHSCWARPLCAGGCHHEALVRYGDTGHANLHYCDWIREWTDICLRIYGRLSAENPHFLERFAARRLNS